MTEIKTIRLASAEELDIAKTFECGQCFRWNAEESGVYKGVVRGSAAKVWTEDGQVYLRSSGETAMWREYFDLGRDYAAASCFEGGAYLAECVRYGMGIRILRQEPWETLCSFIISQCNNIGRIKGIVECLCRMYGDETELEGEQFYSFPSARTLAPLAVEELSALRCGYRAPYIINAAQAVASGRVNLPALIQADWTDARETLLKLHGVGEKVANCVLLFGLHHMEAFPIDIWIRRALKEHFPPGFDPASLGEYAGLAQQYIFYYARSKGK